MKVLLLGYEDIRVKSSPSPSELHADLDLVHVAVQPTFNVFSPAEMKSLKGCTFYN